MTIYVDFVVAEANNVIAVPVAAVESVNNKTIVRMENGELREVVTGFTDGEMVEILSGINEKEKGFYLE